MHADMREGFYGISRILKEWVWVFVGSHYVADLYSSRV